MTRRLEADKCRIQRVSRSRSCIRQGGWWKRKSMSPVMSTHLDWMTTLPEKSRYPTWSQTFVMTSSGRPSWPHVSRLRLHKIIPTQQSDIEAAPQAHYPRYFIWTSPIFNRPSLVQWIKIQVLQTKGLQQLLTSAALAFRLMSEGPGFSYNSVVHPTIPNWADDPRYGNANDVTNVVDCIDETSIIFGGALVTLHRTWIMRSPIWAIIWWICQVEGKRRGNVGARLQLARRCAWHSTAILG